MRPPTSHASDRFDEQAAALEDLRPYLFSIAYRMTGSASESEDIVQDAFLRYLAGDPASVESPRAWLSTVVTRLCLDHLKSARVTREQYRGPWLPEPVLTTDLAPGPDVQAERRDDVSLAFMVLLERLSPEERAAFVLREAFDFRYDDIAEMLGKTSAATRKLLERARRRIATDERKQQSSSAEQRRLTERFLEAARDGKIDALAEVLADDVTIWADGGEDALAARRPVHGRDSIARHSIGLLTRVFPGAALTIEEINGETGLLMWSGDTIVNATTMTVSGDRIVELRAVISPRKLAYLQRRLDPPPTDSR